MAVGRRLLKQGELYTLYNATYSGLFPALWNGSTRYARASAVSGYVDSYSSSDLSYSGPSGNRYLTGFTILCEVDLCRRDLICNPEDFCPSDSPCSLHCSGDICDSESTTELEQSVELKCRYTGTTSVYGVRFTATIMSGTTTIATLTSDHTESTPFLSREWTENKLFSTDWNRFVTGNRVTVTGECRVKVAQNGIYSAGMYTDTSPTSFSLNKDNVQLLILSYNGDV